MLTAPETFAGVTKVLPLFALDTRVFSLLLSPDRQTGTMGGLEFKPLNPLCLSLIQESERNVCLLVTFPPSCDSGTQVYSSALHRTLSFSPSDPNTGAEDGELYTGTLCFFLAIQIHEV